MPDDEHTRLEGLRVRAEDALRRLGGDDLVADARCEARWYADLYFPRADYTGVDRVGWEPVERLVARVMILTRRVERARTEADGTGCRARIELPDRRHRTVPHDGR